MTTIEEGEQKKLRKGGQLVISALTGKIKPNAYAIPKPGSYPTITPHHDMLEAKSLR